MNPHEFVGAAEIDGGDARKGENVRSHNAVDGIGDVDASAEMIGHKTRLNAAGKGSGQNGARNDCFLKKLSGRNHDEHQKIKRGSLKCSRLGPTVAAPGCFGRQATLKTGAR